MAEPIKLTTALNPQAAKLIERYQITDERLAQAKVGKWTQATYAAYLKSAGWKLTRAKAILHYGRKCYLCGDNSQETQIDIHHNNYSRLGNELMSDMIPLCHDCHERHHSQQ